MPAHLLPTATLVMWASMARMEAGNGMEAIAQGMILPWVAPETSLGLPTSAKPALLVTPSKLFP